MSGDNLTGRYRVRAIRPAFQDVNRLVRKTKEKLEIRRHALKLRFWPDQNLTDEAGKLIDLDWSWIRALPELRIGELRLHDTIGGNANLRLIFHVGDTTLREPLPIIWNLRVLQKNRKDFSRHELSIFRARRALVLERFYSDRRN